MDYTAIAEIIHSRHTQIVGLGESTHGTHEFMLTKSSLFKKLVERYGYNTLLLEDTPEVCEPINAYIRSDSDDLDECLTNLYTVWQTHELRDLITWMRDSYKLYPTQFLGFDIEQTANTIDQRDRLMAENIQRYVKASRDTRALVWSHNFHIKLSADNHTSNPMGHYLRQYFGNGYFSIGQFFGTGSFSSSIISGKAVSASGRTLSAIDVRDIPYGFLENVLAAYFQHQGFVAREVMIDMPRFSKMYKARSFGWGVVPTKLDDYYEYVKPSRDFDMITYYPIATHSKFI